MIRDVGIPTGIVMVGPNACPEAFSCEMAFRARGQFIHSFTQKTPTDSSVTDSLTQQAILSLPKSTTGWNLDH